MNYRATGITIDLSAIRHNVKALRADIGDGPELMAVVKANAYGHGLIPAANAAISSGAVWLGVAIPEEGERLRKSGIVSPILVLGSCNALEACASVQNNLTQTVFDKAGVMLLQETCERYCTTVNAHIKIDTGMGRLGVRNRYQLQDVLSSFSHAPRVNLSGAFTHFADADGTNSEYTLRQFELFQEMTGDMPQGLCLHAANSAAALRYPETWLNMVRAGIALYGYPPVDTQLDFRPAMRFFTELACIKEIGEGDCVSYGCTFRAGHCMRIAILPVGYGDGYHRACSGKASVLIGGKMCPVIGRICMDQMMVDVSDVPEAKQGDEAVLLGKQGTEFISADMLGSWAGTISYEVLLSVTDRVNVKYIQ